MRRLLLLLTVVGLFLAGCGGSATNVSDGDATGSTGAVTSEPAVADGRPSAGGPTPFGIVTLVDGTRLDGATYAGHDLALWFWAPW